MKKRSSVIWVFLLCLVSFTTRAQQSAEKRAVEQSLSSFFDALAAADVLAMKSHATDDILILENGASWNMDTLAHLVTMAKGLVIKRTNHIRFLRTEVNGDQGFVAYDNRAEIIMTNGTENRHWLESANLVKRDGVWKIWFLHSTNLQK